MAKPHFNFDDRALKKAVELGVQKMSDDLTRDLNGLTPRYKGRPLEEIKSEIQRVWARHTGGGSVTDPELTRFADMIQQGGSVEIRLAK